MLSDLGFIRWEMAIWQLFFSGLRLLFLAVSISDKLDNNEYDRKTVGNYLRHQPNIEEGTLGIA